MANPSFSPVKRRQAFADLVFCQNLVLIQRKDAKTRPTGRCRPRALTRRHFWVMYSSDTVDLLEQVPPSSPRSPITTPLLHDRRREEDDQLLLLPRVRAALEKFSQQRDVAQKRDFADCLRAAVLDQAAHHDGFPVPQPHDGRGLFDVQNRRRALAAWGFYFVNKTCDCRRNVECNPAVPSHLR